MQRNKVSWTKGVSFSMTENLTFSGFGVPFYIKLSFYQRFLVNLTNFHKHLNQTHAEVSLLEF